MAFNRRLLPVLLAALCIFAAVPVRAQILSVYGTYSGLRAGNVNTSSSSSNSTDLWTNGFGGGVTVNFLPLHIISLGVDLRGSTSPGTPGADSGLAGIKLTIRPPLIHIKPYIQGSAGVLVTRTASATLTNPAYEILGGVDYPLMHFLDLRIIEVGGGKEFGATFTSIAPAASLLTINSGIVLHF
jgi:hypothetical protein